MSAMIVIGRGKGDRRGELTVDPLCFPGAFFLHFPLFLLH